MPRHSRRFADVTKHHRDLELQKFPELQESSTAILHGYGYTERYQHAYPRAMVVRWYGWYEMRVEKAFVQQGEVLLQTCGRCSSSGIVPEPPPDGALVVSQKRSYVDRKRMQETTMVDGSRRTPWPSGTDWRRCTGLACGVSFSIVNKVIK